MEPKTGQIIEQENGKRYLWVNGMRIGTTQHNTGNNRIVKIYDIVCSGALDSILTNVSDMYLSCAWKEQTITKQEIDNFLSRFGPLSEVKSIFVIGDTGHIIQLGRISFTSLQKNYDLDEFFRRISWKNIKSQSYAIVQYEHHHTTVNIDHFKELEDANN